MAVPTGKVVFVTSVKGGSGKTTVVLNLAGMFQKMNKKVLILDFDFYTGAIAASLNIDNTIDLFTLVDDLNNNRFESFEHYTAAYTNWIDIIPAPKDPRTANKINSKYLHIIIGKAKLKYDVILIDSHSVLNDVNLVTMDEADQILYLVTNDPISLKNMRTMVSIYRDMERNNYKIILNESTQKGNHHFTAYDMKHIITDNIDFTLPSSLYTKSMVRSVMDGKILTLDKRYSKKHKRGLEHYQKIANAIVKEKKEKQVG